MNSGLKTLLILLLLGGVVFLVTVIGAYTGSYQPPPEETTTAGTPAADPGPPFGFALTEVGYNPASDDPLIRAFTGFYEASPELNTQSFWFRQPRPEPVKLTVKGRSCTACTSARVGTLPADPLADHRLAVKAGKVPLPFGSAEAATLYGLATAVSVGNQFQWQEFDFDHPEKAVTVPAASPSAPLLGVVQMVFKVVAVGPKTLDAYLAASVPDGTTAPLKLSVSFFGMPAFRLYPTDGKLAVGELPEGAAPRTQDVLVWSVTRRAGTGLRQLPPPAFAVAPRDPFVQVGQPVEVPAGELPKIAAMLEQEKTQPPVSAAYRVPVTIHRTRPATAPPGTPPEPDIGPFERVVSFSVPGEQTTQGVTVTGTVTGLVSLPGGGAVDLKSFPGATGCPPKNFELVSDRPNLKLSVAESDCRPRYVSIKLGEPADRNGRRFWTLTVSVPPGVCQEPFPNDSVVVLLADVGDGSPRRVKVPLKGSGFTRGGR